MFRSVFLVAVFLLIFALSVSATIINIPDDYDTIQEGIDASVDRDTVLVQPGTYFENIDFDGHNIVLGSLFLTIGDTSYISTTIIDGDSSGSVVTFENSEDSTAVIAGFTIQNGHAENGGGIYCHESSPAIINNTITNNSASVGFDGDGGGIYCASNSNPLVEGNTISDNLASSDGGGILCYQSNPEIKGNTISENSASYGGGGISCYSCGPIISENTISHNTVSGAEFGDGGGIFCFNSSPVISNNIINGNLSSGSEYGEGGAILCYQSSPAIKNNTITNNSADDFGGGICCLEASDPLIINTVFWGNMALAAPEILIEGSNPIITYCNIQGGWEGEGNIDIDPLFRDPENGDFHLMFTECGDVYNSPCIDAGDPAIFDSMLGCDWGLGELRSDMGAYGGEGIYTDIDDEQITGIPMQYLLSQNYPNPFNASTLIEYSLPSVADVTVEIYDILGRRVETLVEGEQQAGHHQVVWDASEISSGMYFYRIQAGEFVESKKMLLLK